MSENRHPAGTSLGGQWAPGSAGEVDLDDLPDGQYDSYDEHGNATADEGTHDSTSDVQLDRVLGGFGMDTHRDCPGLAQAWQDKYGDGSPESEEERNRHLDDAQRGSRPPWNVLADEKELHNAKMEKIDALLALNDSHEEGTKAGSLHYDSAKTVSSILESDDPDNHQVDVYGNISVKYLSDFSEDVADDSNAETMKDLRRRELAEEAQGVEGPATLEASRVRQAANELNEARRRRNARVDVGAERYNKAADKMWALGWTGTRSELPARPNPMKAENSYF